jgi:hypothetical protein
MRKSTELLDKKPNCDYNFLAYLIVYHQRVGVTDGVSIGATENPPLVGICLIFAEKEQSWRGAAFLV